MTLIIELIKTCSKKKQKMQTGRGKKLCVRSGVRTHALFRVPELKSGALDHSAILTTQKIRVVQYQVKHTKALYIQASSSDLTLFS